ncbi:class I SAM-dependent methyltransferase [Streptosporangium sp. NPDC000396]|uniref:class I SAM-dependent methyltransferase n=1 Tax=Streptosporangium sp. NPDC000396 TaxID=3366185 RepID=UPI0036CE4CCB
MNHATSASLFDGIAAGYDDDLFHQLVAEKLVGGVTPGSPPNTVLDVASGTGAAAFAALRHLRAEHVIAVDLSAGMIDRAIAKAAIQDPEGRIAWRVAPAVPAPVGSSSVDVVLCASSLHFLGAEAFQDWLRVLRPGGQLAFTLPFAETFTPSGAMAELVAADLRLPVDEDQAAALATDAGFEHAVAQRFETSDERLRVVFLVHATSPG